MTRSLFLVLPVLAMGAVVYGSERRIDELTDPLEILQKADAATKAVDAVKYNVRFSGGGDAGAQAPSVEGSVLLSGWFAGAPEKFLCEAKVRQPDSRETLTLTAGSDSQVFYLIDHYAKKAHVDINPGVVGATGRAALALRVLEFVAEAPFGDEINARSRVLKGIAKIGDEECYEIDIVYAVPGAPEATWFFSTRDFLPRGVLRKFKTPQGEQANQQWTLTDLVVDPKFFKDPFKLRLPSGYTRTDEFAR